MHNLAASKDENHEDQTDTEGEETDEEEEEEESEAEENVLREVTKREHKASKPMVGGEKEGNGVE